MNETFVVTYNPNKELLVLTFSDPDPEEENYIFLTCPYCNRVNIDILNDRNELDYGDCFYCDADYGAMGLKNLKWKPCKSSGEVSPLAGWMRK